MSATNGRRVNGQRVNGCAAEAKESRGRKDHGRLRTAFVGAVEGSRIALQALIAQDLKPGLVVTLPRSVAEARHSDAADLVSVAQAAGIAVHETRSINAEATIAVLRDFGADLMLVIGWSQICGADFLALPRLGSIGFHPAALPRLRGRAVIPWTILLEEKTAGSTLFWLDEGTDAGPIVLQRTFDLRARETARSLYDTHTANLKLMVPEAVRMVAGGLAPGIEQDEERAVVCARRRPEDGQIDWMCHVDEVDRLVRAVGDPYPPAFTTVDGERLEVLQARPVRGGPTFIGFTGQVQAWDSDEAFLVRCGNGECLRVERWSGPAPRLHARLDT